MWFNIVIAVGVTVLCACATSLVILRTLMRHVHEYDPVAAQTPAAPILAAAGVQSTVVLHRCDCGEITTRTLTGRWTLDQIRGTVPVVRALPVKEADA